MVCHINYVLYQKTDTPSQNKFRYLCINLVVNVLHYDNYIIKQNIRAKRVYRNIYIMSKDTTQNVVFSYL